MTLQPRLTVQRPNNAEFDLWFAQECLLNRDVNVDDRTFIGFHPEDAFMLPLEQEWEYQLSGETPPSYLSTLPEYSDDRRQAAATWIQEIEHLAVRQGEGHTFHDRVYDNDLQVYVTGFDWNIQLPEVDTITWTMQLQVGRGIEPSGLGGVEFSSPTQTATLDGIHLGYVNRYGSSMNVETDTRTIPNADTPEQNLIKPEGPLQRFTLEGFMELSKVSKFEDRLANPTDRYPYQSPIPGAEYTVDVSAFDTEKTTETPVGVVEYEMELTRGQ